MTTTTNRTDLLPIAVIDVDGVLYDYVANLALCASARLGRPLSQFPPALVWDFYKEQWGMTTAEFLDLVNASVTHHGFLANGDPYDFALEGFQLLRDNDIQVHIATHIGEDGDPDGHRAARRQWLETTGFVFDDLTFTADKASVAASYLQSGHPVFALEDNVDNYRALRDCGAQAYLLDQAWNRHEASAPRVPNVLAFAEVVCTARG